MFRLHRWTRAENYAGHNWPGFFVFAHRNRDSVLLEKYNFECVVKALDALPDYDGANEEGSRFIVREGHWACGWVEWLAIADDDAAGLAAARVLEDRLERYPVLDEEGYSIRQWSVARDNWEDASVGLRLSFLRESRASVSMFASRRPEMPYDDDGRLLDYLSTF